jgi:DNA-binding MarR family transcriptional regulator
MTTAADRQVQALDRVLELTVLLEADLRTSLAKDGTTPSRAPVLWYLGTSGPCTQRSVADALGLAARTVTGLVDGLEESGHVTRKPHPTDRRATLLTLTTRGRRLVTRWQRQQGELAEQLFGAMPPRRLAAMVAGLDDVLGVLRELVPADVRGRS